MEKMNIPSLIDIGGRHLAMRSEGEGLPTVVLETGLGGSSGMYDAVARQIATFTRVVWYDRAGLGKSDPAPTPRTVRDLASDLHALLQKAEIPGPYVLAGHSMGGPVVRFYRERYPEEVVGMVLIDASHEDQRDRYLALLPPQQPDEWPDLTRLRHIFEMRWIDPNRNEEHIDNPANRRLLHACHNLGDLPLAVISRGRPTHDPARYPAGLVEAMEQTWRQMQGELARLSTRSQHIIATQSGHLINQDEPALIVDTLQKMVAQIREHLSWDW